MTDQQKQSTAMKGAYLTGRREESQEVKAHLARLLRTASPSEAETIRTVLASIGKREHSQTELPPPAL